MSVLSGYWVKSPDLAYIVDRIYVFVKKKTTCQVVASRSLVESDGFSLAE
jgi:hypothetical protein